jgi:hypothetical protein
MDVIGTAKMRRAVLGVALGLTLAGGSWGACVAQAVVPVAATGGTGPRGVPSDARIFPLSEVHKGLKGVAYTVFEGVNPEAMDLVILGVLKDAIGPGQDMILARLTGEKPEYTGVVAGMSGSPVYIDGRLAGALSYRIGQFSKEPIAGITPIEAMFAVRDGAETRAGRGSAKGSGEVASLGPEQGLSRTNDLLGGAYEGMEVRAIETPLVFGGFSPETVERFGDRFRAMGLMPVAGLGGADSTKVQPEPLVPGSAVSLVLVRGDLSMSGTCTVTYVDPKRLLACGHPITQFGTIDMPMTKAEVIATLASPLNAFKIINTTETVGAFREDRTSAILGRLGEKARMIPVEVEVAPVTGFGGAGHDAGAEAVKTFHFEVVDNRELTPQAMMASLYQTLQATNASGTEMSFKVSGELGLQGLPPVRMATVMAKNEQNSGAINAALYVGDRLNKVYSNGADQPVVTGLKLRVESIPERRSAVIESARLSRQEVAAGETVEVEVMVHPYQADARMLRTAVKLPEGLAAGPLRVVVSDGGTVDRLTAIPPGPGSDAARRTTGLADAVAQLNAGHPNDAVYVTLLDHEAQAVLESGALESVPLSMANVLGPLKDAQRMQLTGESVVEAGRIATGYSVSGFQVLTVMIR